MPMEKKIIRKKEEEDPDDNQRDVDWVVVAGNGMDCGRRGQEGHHHCRLRQGKDGKLTYPKVRFEEAT